MKLLTGLTVVVLLIVTLAPAHAYIDAGSGSYMLQMAMAGLLAVVFSLKMFWQRLRTNVSGLLQNRPQAGTRSGE